MVLSDEVIVELNQDTNSSLTVHYAIAASASREWLQLHQGRQTFPWHRATRIAERDSVGPFEGVDVDPEIVIGDEKRC